MLEKPKLLWKGKTEKHFSQMYVQNYYFIIFKFFSPYNYHEDRISSH